MGLFQAIISGIVQGVAEFLPISSSGHLVILHKLTGSSEPEILFDLFLHLGTLVAVFIVFGRDIIESITTKKRLGFLILLGSAVTFVFVLFFIKNIEAAFSNVRMVGAMFIVTALKRQTKKPAGRLRSGTGEAPPADERLTPESGKRWRKFRLCVC